MKALVMGGAGYIGSNTVKLLLDEGHLVVMSRQSLVGLSL